MPSRNNNRGGQRSRGGRGGGSGRGGSRGRGRGGGLDLDDFDYPVQVWREHDTTPGPNRGSYTPRAQGRTRDASFNNSGSNTPRGGYRSPRGFGSRYGNNTPQGGRGRGGSTFAPPYGLGGRSFASKARGGTPLSKLLHEDRPLLRPIMFVRSTLTATLFKDESEEELLKAGVESAADDEQSHLPTASVVARVFSGMPPRDPDDDDDDNDDGNEGGPAGSEELVEIDFADLGKFQAEIDASAAAKSSVTTTLQTHTVALSQTPENTISAEVSAVQESFSGFYIDSTPSPIQPATIAINRVRNNGVLGETKGSFTTQGAHGGREKRAQETKIIPQAQNRPGYKQRQEDDEIIVYVAPHPRAGRDMPVDEHYTFEAASRELFPPSDGEIRVKLNSGKNDAAGGDFVMADPAVVFAGPSLGGVGSTALGELSNSKPSRSTSTTVHSDPAVLIAVSESIPTDLAETHTWQEKSATAALEDSQIDRLGHTSEYSTTTNISADTTVTTAISSDTAPVINSESNTQDNDSASGIPADEEKDTLTEEVNIEIVPNTSDSLSTFVAADSAAVKPGNDSVPETSTSPSAVDGQPQAPTPAAANPPSFDDFSFATINTPQRKTPKRVFIAGKGTPRSLVARLHAPRRKALRSKNLAAFAAAVSEAQLREQGRDPREKEQRRGDSDVDWGDGSDADEAAGVDAANDMDVDGDIDINAMRRFVQGMSAQSDRHVTMDDLADEARMREEDREDGGSGSNSDSDGQDDDAEMEDIFAQEERALVGETENDGIGSDDDDSSDDEATPRRGFQARLDKIRANASGKRSAHAGDLPDDDSNEEDIDMEMTLADEDEVWLSTIESILDENADILSRKDRKKRNELFRSIQNGDFDIDEFDEMLSPAKRNKDRPVLPELRDQWERDRAKKAENKRRRAEARLLVAADPLAQHKGGKKGRKAMLAAARLDGSIAIRNRVVDFGSLEQQIRRFLEDIGGKTTMALPPADKETRKKVHELAQAFNLKSRSEGKGNGRYTVLTKTTRSGIAVNESKVHSILKRVGVWVGPAGRRNQNVPASLAKHKEGEEVGKEAPKISQSNVGFQMLAAMGWTEGDRIGLSGGLTAPLTAIMKKTKLGLGATL